MLPVYDEASSIGAMRRLRADAPLKQLFDLKYAVYPMSHDSTLAPLTTIPTHVALELSGHRFAPRESASALGALLDSA